MTWRNILDLPGIDGVGADNDYAGGSADFSTAAGQLVFAASEGLPGATWYGFGIHGVDLGNLADLVERPCNIRCTATYSHVDGHPENVYFVIYCGSDVSPDSQPADPNTAGFEGEYTAEGIVGSDDNFFVRPTSLDTSAPLANVSLLIEVDGDLITSDKWSNFRISEEAEGTLVKPMRTFTDPGQHGRPFIPPSHTCHPLPPPPPTGDPPPGGGGGGSGPPEGDLPICIFVWVPNTDPDGNLLGGGNYIPINAPCRVE